MSAFEDDDIDAELQAIIAQAPPLRPSRDLWPGIAARIASLGARGAPPIASVIAARAARRPVRWLSSHALAAGVVVCCVAATYVATRLSLGPRIPMTLMEPGGRGAAVSVGSAYQTMLQPAELAFAPEIEAVSARTQESAATATAWSRHRRSESIGESQTIDTTIDFDRSGVVDLGLMSGTITVSGWDRSQAKIHAISEAAPITSSFSDTRINLDVTPGADGFHDKAKFTLTVPFGTRVIAHSISGDLRVEDVRGPLDGHTVTGGAWIQDAGGVTLESVSGDLEVHGVNGDLKASDVSGGIDLANVQGDVDVSTVSGDIRLPLSHSHLVHMQSVSGDVTYGGPIEPTGRYEFRSHSGDVTLRLPSNAAAALSLVTFSGDVDADFPIALKEAQHFGPGHQIEALLGAGGGHVGVETFSGDIKIQRGIDK